MSDKAPTGHFGDGNGGNTLPANSSQLEHIFGNRPGHLPDTPRNRQLLIDVANDEGNFLGTDKYGNVWHARQETDGSQTWTTSRDGTIQNGGRNNPPRDWDNKTGLNNNPFRKR